MSGWTRIAAPGKKSLLRIMARSEWKFGHRCRGRQLARRVGTDHTRDRILDALIAMRLRAGLWSSSADAVCGVILGAGAKHRE